ncbi:MAG TPA: type II 3-dehydroquinate dehydratase [Beutenbergiaceae bacterium]|nr:type II 3-dehydroquinate dehydratase [Beutenbergiaceae bacterium]
MKPVLVLSGPNLARLGSREPDVYGTTSYADLARLIEGWARDLGFTADIRQTDSEAELIGWLHEAADAGTDVVINPAAFTHYAYAVRDAAAQVRSAGAQLIEIHLTNPATRERFRHLSVIAGVATGTIAGFGPGSYHLALRAIADD